ncbi:MAG: hypothetical protein AAF990_05295 [Bacteroidota bacterium]
MNDPYNSDDLFKRSGRTDRQFPFNEMAWEDMEARLGESERRRPWPFWLWGSAFVVLAISMGWIWSQNQETILTSLFKQQSVTDEESEKAPIVKVRTQKAMQAEALVEAQRISSRGKRAESEEEEPSTMPGPASIPTEAVPTQRSSNLSEAMPRRAVATASGSTVEIPQNTPAIEPNRAIAGPVPKATTNQQADAIATASSDPVISKQSVPPQPVNTSLQPTAKKASPPSVAKQMPQSVKPRIGGSPDQPYGAGIASGLSNAIQLQQPINEESSFTKGWEVSLRFSPDIIDVGSTRGQFSGEPIGSALPFTRFETSDNRVFNLYYNGFVSQEKKKFHLGAIGLGIGKWLSSKWHVNSNIYYSQVKTDYLFSPDASLNNSIMVDSKYKAYGFSWDLRLQYMFNSEGRFIPFISLGSMFDLYNSYERYARTTSRFNEINEENSFKGTSGFRFISLAPEAGLRFRVNRRFDVGARASYHLTFPSITGLTVEDPFELSLQVNYRLQER